MAWLTEGTSAIASIEKHLANDIRISIRIREPFIEPRPLTRIQMWRIRERDPVRWSRWHNVLVLIPDTEIESCADNNWNKDPRLADV